ncbi:MAG: Ig-like domain-containing protein [Chthoniobacterales bacterium]
MTFQPGKVYVFALNEVDIPGVGFQTQKGIALPPTYLVFRTEGNLRAEDAPPRVLGTSPPNGAQDVNPVASKGVVVSFDRFMATGKHGLHLWENERPVDLRATKFTYSADGKIFTLNYQLKPSTHYEVRMNSTDDIGFTATNRVPLWPYRFLFVTGQPH